MMAGISSDYLISNVKLKAITVRKIMSTIGLCVAGISIALTGHVGCNPLLIVSLLATSMSFIGVTTSGFKANHVEFAPGRSNSNLLGCNLSFKVFRD